MNPGSSILECLVALGLTTAIACGAMSSLLTCSALTRTLNADHRLAQITDLIDGLQAIDPGRSKRTLFEAVAWSAARIDPKTLNCELDNEHAAIRCDAQSHRRFIPIVDISEEEP